MLDRRGSLWTALALAAGLVVATMLASQTVLRVMRMKYRDQTISVTGSARQRIRSDLVVWTATVSARATERAAAYTELAASVGRVRDYLRQRGVPAAQTAVESVEITAQHARTPQGEEIPEQVIGYVLSQPVVVTSRDVDRVTQVARDVTELINQGVVVQSAPPRYIFTGLATLKVRLLAEASRDARVRAEQIAAQTLSHVRGLSTAQMGVIQVNAANETEVSAEGVNDTSSLEKDALAVVRAVFYVE